MAIEENKTTAGGGRFGLLLRRADQVTIAVILAIALVVIFFSFVRCSLQGGGLVEIELREPQVVEFGIDINRAEWPEFALLPGVGETLARRIVETRERLGPFSAHEDLGRVNGVGPRKLDAIRPYLLPMETIQQR